MDTTRPTKAFIDADFSEIDADGLNQLDRSRLAVDPSVTMVTPSAALPEDGEPVWERLPGEEMVDYLLFEVYRQLRPHERSIRRTWRTYCLEHLGKPFNPNTIDYHFDKTRATAATWRWQQRAEAWDEYLLQQDRADEIAAKLVARKARRARMIRVEGAVNDALKTFTELMAEGYKPRPAEMTAMLKLLHDETRTEFDDNPAKKVKHEGEVEHSHKVYMGWDPKSIAAPKEE